MAHPKNIVCRVAIWLTALLLPVEAMPGYHCGCITSAAAVAQSPAKTCGKAGKRCCCGKTKSQGCCCSNGTSHSTPTSNCQCAKAHPAHDQVPPSGNSQNQTVKTLTAALAAPALGSDVVTTAPSTATHLVILPGQTSLERLSTLCRLVV